MMAICVDSVWQTYVAGSLYPTPVFHFAQAHLQMGHLDGDRRGHFGGGLRRIQT